MTGGNDVEQVFEQARAVADAVLYEGYVLYPYRASAAKNQLRWQWGVLVPPGFAAFGNGERSAARCECLLEPVQGGELVVRLRLLQLVERTVEVLGPAGFEPVESLPLADRVLVAWSEARECQHDLRLGVAELLTGPREVVVGFDGGEQFEAIADAPPGVTARLRRRSWALAATLGFQADLLPGPYGLTRLRVTVANRAEADAAAEDREVALRTSLIATHLLVGVTRGRFQSLADPPQWAAGFARECSNDGVWPVLIADGAAVLASPIILDDNPSIAPESPGDLYDGLEIDEILTLRTMALTEAEKAEARGTDARAAAVVDRADSLPPAVLERLHGAIRSLRAVTGEAGASDPVPTMFSSGGDGADSTAAAPLPWWDPGSDPSVNPDTDTVAVEGSLVGRGSRVLLEPQLRGSDAQDFLLVGEPATVRRVLHDVDGGIHLAVTLDNDPAADVADATGRYRYFRPSEVRLPADRR